jgi:hypothetical protein
MKSYHKYLWTAVLLVFGLTSCVSAEERLNTKFDTLPEIDSTLVYEYSAEYSGATGGCTGTFLDRWYGTKLDAETVSELYSDSFLKDGWVIWPEDVVEIWSMESKDGLYRVDLDVFADPTHVSKQQYSYRLPDSDFRELSHYRTVYVLSMTYRSLSVARRCFGK